MSLHAGFYLNAGKRLLGRIRIGAVRLHAVRAGHLPYSHQSVGTSLRGAELSMARSQAIDRRKSVE